MKFVIKTKSGMYFAKYDNLGKAEFTCNLDKALILPNRFLAKYHLDEITIQGFDCEIIKL